MAAYDPKSHMQQHASREIEYFEVIPFNSIVTTALIMNDNKTNVMNYVKAMVTIEKL